MLHFWCMGFIFHCREHQLYISGVLGVKMGADIF